jgi:hypothetical protein
LTGSPEGVAGLARNEIESSQQPLDLLTLFGEEDWVPKAKINMSKIRGIAAPTAAD